MDNNWNGIYIIMAAASTSRQAHYKITAELVMNGESERALKSFQKSSLSPPSLLFLFLML
jgi:hypothetical protein